MTAAKTFLDERSASETPFTPSSVIPSSNVQDAIEYVWNNVSGGVSGTYAPSDAEYLVKTATGDLSAERVITDTATITWDFSTLGQAKANWSHLGIESLSDPNADRIAFWDDSAGAFAWLTATAGIEVVGTNLSITNANLVDIRDATFSTGDLLYYDGADLVPLAIGSYSQWLRVGAGGVPEWVAFPSGSGTGDLMSFNNLSELTDYPTARSNLGLAIGSDVQAYDAELAALAGLTSAADALPYFTGSGTAATTTLTSFARSILDDTDEATFKATVNLEIGTDVQAYDAGLASIAGLTTAADRMLYTTASDTYAVTTLTSFARSILDDADEATFKATVNLEIGTDVQAWDAGLDDIAGLTPTDGNIIVGDGANWVAESGATARASLGLTIGTNVQAYSANLTSWSAVTPSQYTTVAALASTANGDGAALVGIEDSGAYFAGSTVESALQYLGSAVAALDQAVVLKGNWDASSGSFPGAGAAQAGWSYIVSVDGTVDGVDFVSGDRIVAITDNASTSTYASNWLKLDYTDRVSSVAGRTGAVTLTSTDLTDVTAFARTVLDDADAATARTTLGAAASGANTDITSVALSNLGLVVKDASESFGLTIRTNTTLTADRTLTLSSMNANRTLTISGNTALNQNVRTTDSPTFAGLTLTAALGLGDGGTGSALTDPNADRILFWDDGAGATTWLTATNGTEISGTDLQMTSNQRTGCITYVIDGGGSAITTGTKGFLEIPFACTIQQVTMLADQSGSIVVDIWKDTYANYPPTDADSITASAVPTISAAAKSVDATLTGWTTAIAAGDILGFNVDSATTVERVTISLEVVKT